MDERNPQDLKKLILVFVVGVPILAIEFFRAILPSDDAAPRKQIITQETLAPASVRVDSNPNISWFEKHFCMGYKTTGFCKFFGSKEHPRSRD